MSKLINIAKKNPWILPTVIFTVMVSLGAFAHTLWADEAESAFYAKNILSRGLPYAFDGINITSINIASALDKNLLNHLNVWLQFYLIAASFKLFGFSSLAARLPFLLLSFTFVPLIYFSTYYSTKNKRTAFIASLIACLSVPLILFSFQARYYGLNIVFGLAMILFALKISQKKTLNKFLFVLCFVGFLYSHYLSAIIFYISLLFAIGLSSFYKNKDLIKSMGLLKTYIFLGIVSIIIFAPWFILANPFGTSQGSSISNVLTFIATFPLWFYFGSRYFNANGVFPVLFLILLGVVSYFRLKMKKDLTPLIFYVSLVSVYLLIVAGLSAFILTSGTFFTEIRYNVILIPVLLIICSLIFSDIWKWNKPVCLILLVLYIFTNIFTFTTPKSYLFLYIQEVLNPYKTSNDAVANYLNTHAKDGETVFVNSDRAHEPLFFLIEKKLKFVNRLAPDNIYVFPENYGVLPTYLYSFMREPDWVILFSNHKTSVKYFDFDIRGEYPEGLHPSVNLKRDYDLTILPIFYGSDVARPELEVHLFKLPKPKYDEQVFIYRLKKAQ